MRRREYQLKETQWEALQARVDMGHGSLHPVCARARGEQCLSPNLWFVQ